jgi:hypothetical protein
MRIVVHVERLVLEGLPLERRDGEVVRAAVTRELTRLLGTGVPPQALATGGSLPSVSAPPIQLGAAAAPARVGREIARSVHRGLDG